MAYTMTAHERTGPHAQVGASEARVLGAPHSHGVNAVEFDALARANAAAIARYLGRLGVSPSDVLDVSQQVLLLAYTKWNEFRGDASRKSWLYGIARNSAADYRKMAKRKERAYARFETSTHLLSPGVHDPEEKSSASAELRLLDKVLSDLADSVRETFVLFEIEGLTMTEITAITGVPLQTGYSRLRVAREAVRRAFAELEAGEP